MSPFRIPRSLVLASMCLVVAAAGLASAADEQGRKVEQLTGGRTRVVWEGWTHPAEGAEQAGIAGYDSADGKPRVLTKNAGAWHSPFFTPDGNAVIYNVGQFSGGSEGSKIVNWDGTDDRWLVKGEFGWAHCLRPGWSGCTCRTPTSGVGRSTSARSRSSTACGSTSRRFAN